MASLAMAVTAIPLFHYPAAGCRPRGCNRCRSQRIPAGCGERPLPTAQAALSAPHTPSGEAAPLESKGARRQARGCGGKGGGPQPCCARLGCWAHSTQHAVQTNRKGRSFDRPFLFVWLPRMDSNHRMPESESGALPLGDGAKCACNYCTFSLQNQGLTWWLWVDSNHRPQHHECCALTG